MKSLTSNVVACLIALLLANNASVCYAQKSSAEPIKPEPPKTADIDKWRQAYEEADRPTILVLCGWTTGAQQAPDPGNTLFNFDDSGTAGGLRTAFEKVINHPRADVDLVSDDARRAAQSRLQRVLDIRDEKEAIALLHTELSAELIIIMKLHGQRGSAPTRVIVESSNADVARKGFQQAFDWKVGISQADVNQYANILADRFIEDFADRIKPVQRLTVRVLGLMDASHVNLTHRTFGSTEDVVRVNRRNVATGKADAITEFEITCDSIADNDLVTDALAANLQSALGLGIEIVKQEARSVVLRVNPAPVPLPPAAVKDCAEAFTSKTDTGEMYRTDLTNLYKMRNSPRIAILINRAQTPDEIAQSGINAENLIIVNTAVAAGDANAGGGSRGAGNGDGTVGAGGARFFRPHELELQARGIEREMMRSFRERHLHLNTFDIDDAMLSHLEPGKSTLSKNELIAALKRENRADILIHGYGRIERIGGEMHYGFTAVNISDSSQTGFADATINAWNGTQADIERLAEIAFCELACSMRNIWKSTPQTADIEIRDAAGIEDWESIRKAMRDRGIDVVQQVGDGKFEQGVIRCRVNYFCSSDELNAWFTQLSERVGFKLTFLSKSDRAITFKIDRGS